MDAPKITPADAGCWLDGAMGWHNTYRVAERALDLGWLADKPDEKASAEKTIALYKASESQGMGNGESYDVFDVMQDISTDATDYLQSLAPEGYSFEWDAGELCLWAEDAPE